MSRHVILTNGLALILAFACLSPSTALAAEKSDAKGLGVLLGVSSVFSALAPESHQHVSYCDRYLSQQPAAIYYGDFWRVQADGRFSYDPAVKSQFQGVMYREDGKVISISQLRRNDAQKEVKLYLDANHRIQRLEYRFASGPLGNSQIQTETHLFARSGDTCVPLERRDDVSKGGSRPPIIAIATKNKNLRYNLALCRDIRRYIAADTQRLSNLPLSGSLSKSLRETFAKHDLLEKGASKPVDDSLVASQALIILHECESTAGVREALFSAKAPTPPQNL